MAPLGVRERRASHVHPLTELATEQTCLKFESETSRFLRAKRRLMVTLMRSIGSDIMSRMQEQESAEAMTVDTDTRKESQS